MSVTMNVRCCASSVGAPADFDGRIVEVAKTVGAGLVLGKPLGILALTWFSVRLGLAALPRGVTWSQVAVVGCAAGIGFTMALFIAELAFPDGALLETAKLAVVAASGVASVLGLAMGILVLPREPVPVAARKIR